MLILQPADAQQRQKRQRPHQPQRHPKRGHSPCAYKSRPDRNMTRFHGSAPSVQWTPNASLPPIVPVVQVFR